MERLAPKVLALPNGKLAPVDYRVDPPTVRAKLHDVFGLPQLPQLLSGAQRLQLQLLQPNGHKYGKTTDLASYWANTYRASRVFLAQTYPDMTWPEDPLQVVPRAPGDDGVET